MEQEKLISELTFKAVRSSGPGGQNVNKVSSKVILFFDLGNTKALADDEKATLLEKLSSKLTSENILILNCEQDRSQVKNKEIVIKKFLDLLKKGLFKPKARKPTKIPKSVIAKRLKNKTTTAVIKVSRKKPDLE